VKSDDRRRRRTGLPAWIGWAVAAALIGGGASATVLPQGPAVVGSTSGPGATFSYSGPSTLTINQSASRVVIDWNSFSIGAGGTVNFVQTSPGWIAFNRVN
jgi:large exoprotein involved in heme utilization and adhesion